METPDGEIILYTIGIHTEVCFKETGNNNNENRVDVIDSIHIFIRNQMQQDKKQANNYT